MIIKDILLLQLKKYITKKEKHSGLRKEESQNNLELSAYKRKFLIK